jgi:hypothetical protein
MPARVSLHQSGRSLCRSLEINEVDLKRATKALKEPWRWWK